MGNAARELAQSRNLAHASLKAAVDMANDLIRTMRNKGLTEDDVEQLAGDENAHLKTLVAAAGSKLLKLKGGITLVQISDEGARLNTYLEPVMGGGGMRAKCAETSMR